MDPTLGNSSRRPRRRAGGAARRALGTIVATSPTSANAAAGPPTELPRSAQTSVQSDYHRHRALQKETASVTTMNTTNTPINSQAFLLAKFNVHPMPKRFSTISAGSSGLK